jgi:hypothetical protein
MNRMNEQQEQRLRELEDAIQKTIDLDRQIKQWWWNHGQRERSGHIFESLVALNSFVQGAECDSEDHLDD